jgi:hypothetical protein
VNYQNFKALVLAVCRRGEFDCHNRQTAIDFSQIIASK